MTGRPAPGEQPGASSLPRYPVLDELRGSAVVTVIVFHCLLAIPTTSGRAIDNFVEPFVDIMPYALDLFFVISGFLITLILDRTRHADHTIRTFYARRALRIVPLYYGFLLVAALFLGFLGPRAVGTPGSTVWEWFFLTNFVIAFKSTAAVGSLYPHFWTLAVEEHFYLIWPWVVVFLTPRRLVSVCVAIALLSFVGRIILSLNDLAYASWFLTPTRLDGLALGALVALLHRHQPETLRRWAGPAFFSAVVIVVVFYFILPAAFRGDAQISDGAWAMAVIFLTSAGLLLSSIIFASVVAFVAMRNERPRVPGRVASLLRSVARYSYGMYAFHVPIMVILFHTGRIEQRHPLGGYDLPYRVAFALMILSLSYIAGLLSWHLYEKKILRLAPSYSYRVGSPSPSAGPELQALPVP